jgi:hypothetical protein
LQFLEPATANDCGRLDFLASWLNLTTAEKLGRNDAPVTGEKPETIVDLTRE